MSSKQQTKLIPKQMLVKGSKNYYNNVVGINSATIVLYSTAGFQKKHLRSTGLLHESTVLISSSNIMVLAHFLLCLMLQCMICFCAAGEFNGFFFYFCCPGSL